MRERSKIKQQLKQVVYRHYQKKLRHNLKKKPSTCLYNREIDLGGGEQVSVCGFMSGQGVPRNVLCDGRHDNSMEQARTCPLWEPLLTKETMKKEHSDLMAGDRGAIALEYPDVAALMWVLDAEEEEEVEEDEGLNSMEPSTEEKGFWKRIFGS